MGEQTRMLETVTTQIVCGSLDGDLVRLPSCLLVGALSFNSLRCIQHRDRRPSLISLRKGLIFVWIFRMDLSDKYYSTVLLATR